MMSDKGAQQNPLSKSFLGKNFYVVVTTPTAPREKLEPLIPAYFANRVRLEKEGIMFAAGPLTKEDGTRYGGMFGCAPTRLRRRVRLRTPIRCTRQGCAATR
jgi:hypothetical protein